MSKISQNRYFKKILNLIIFLPASALIADEKVGYFYDVYLNKHMNEIKVEVCFKGIEDKDKVLYPISLDASLALQGVRTVKNKKKIVPSASIDVSKLTNIKCIYYKVDITRDYNVYDRTGSKIEFFKNAKIINNNIWLWLPNDNKSNHEIFFNFHAMRGIDYAIPWKRNDLQNDYEYVYGKTPITWQSNLVIGKLSKKNFLYEGVKFHTVFLEGNPNVKESKIVEWVKKSFRAYKSTSHLKSVKNIQTVFIPNAYGKNPIAQAYLTRGGFPSIQFYINQRKVDGQLSKDWTAIHEFSHLYLPYIELGDSWLTEGLATYYETILPIRFKKLSESEMWLSFFRKLENAEYNFSDITLKKASEVMHYKNTYKKVYWEGAGIFLKGDIILRKNSNNMMTLDKVIYEFSNCCFDYSSSWTGKELFHKFDEISKTKIFSTLYEEIEGQKIKNSLFIKENIGILFNSGKITFLEDKTKIKLRNQILQN